MKNVHKKYLKKYCNFWRVPRLVLGSRKIILTWM